MKDYYSTTSGNDLPKLATPNHKLDLHLGRSDMAIANDLAFVARLGHGFGSGTRVTKGLGYRHIVKRSLDILLVLLSLPVTVLVIGLCALALIFEGGSPFYTQKRLGVGGKRFNILKLRTMVRDADAVLERVLEADPALREEWETTQKLKNDPRVTRLGAILRSTSLDELPQLWNVLIGDMSLVGPRPMMPEQLPLYGDPRAYFALRPGITGYWQISARNEKHFSFRNEIDAIYDDNLSFKNDLTVLIRTVGVVLRRTGY